MYTIYPGGRYAKSDGGQAELFFENRTKSYHGDKIGKLSLRRVVSELEGASVA
jgi:hypothetical protein